MQENVENLFSFDQISGLLLCLIIIIGFSVFNFTRRYFTGDHLRQISLVRSVVLIASLAVMVLSNHVIPFLIAMLCANVQIVRLMVHKKSWQQSHFAGQLSSIYLALTLLTFSTGFGVLYADTGQLTFDALNQISTIQFTTKIALLILLIAAMAQSALWPFHGWLLSSLNAPSSVSALMHAGIINGGGIVLMKLFPLFYKAPELMLFVFVSGCFSAILGNAFKLVQTDIKRTLACSTMSQMGYLFMQCGLGLYPVAMAHLFYHGIYKAFLFLNIGNLAGNQPKNSQQNSSWKILLKSLTSGAVAVMLFSQITQYPLLSFDASLVFLIVSFVLFSQIVVTLEEQHLTKNSFISFIYAICFAMFYGVNIRLFDFLLNDLSMYQAYPLHIAHLIGAGLLFAMWLFRFCPQTQTFHFRDWRNRLYVWLINRSQPHPETVTAFRNDYRYK